MPTHAEIYRTVDSNGNVIFTDAPEDDNAEKVIVDVAPSYVPPTIPAFVVEEQDTSNQQTTAAVPKYKIKITSPTHDEMFQNPETIAVTASISPALNEQRGDQVIFKLDGKQVGNKQNSLSTVLEGVYRGSHVLVVSVVDKSGKVLKSSKSVLFHVQRNSILR